MSNEEKQPEEEKQPKERKKRKGKPHRRGSGSVFRRPERKGGKEWVAQIILENGKTRQRYFYTQAEADEALNEMLYEQKRGMLASGPKQKLADHLNWWLDEVKRQRLRESSYIRYRYALDKHILPALGDIQLQRLTTQKLQSFYNSKQKERQSPSSIQTMHKVLHGALDYAVNIHLLAYNPSDHVSLPRQVKRKAKPLTLEQARHLVHVARGSSLEGFLTLALATGMRHGELVALRWEDVDLEKGSVFIHRTARYQGKSRILEGDAKTASSERVLPISRTVCGMLAAHKARQNEERLQAGPAWEDHHLVFCNRRGRILIATTTRAQFLRLLRKADVPPMHIHDLRHTAATLFRSMGVDLKVVQEILGHSQLDMTLNVYSHVLPSMQTAAMEKIDGLFQ
jgi:integrase